MNINKKVIGIVLVAILVVSASYYVYFYLPTKEEEARWQEWKDTLILGTTEYEVNPDPQIGWVGLDYDALPLICDTLFWSPYDKVGEIRYQIAESATVKFETINETQFPYLEVKLRQGLHFNNGEEITADDVLYSMKRRLIKEPGRIGTYKWVFDYGRFGEDTFVVLDKYTLKYRIPSSFPMVAIALNGLSCISFAIVNEDAAEKYGEGLDVAKFGCSGPLILTEWVANEKMVYLVRENYKDPITGGWVEGMGKADDVWPPQWKRLIISTYADSTSLAMALKKGEVDISAGPHSLAEVQNLNDSGMIVRTIPGMNVRTLFLNFAFPPLDNLKVRQAIAYALDPMENIQKVMLGLAAPGYSLLHSDYFYYVPAFQDKYQLFGHRTPEKLAKAKALLAEAGYPDGFEITYVQSSVYGSDEQEQMDALIIQSQLADIGIKVNIQSVDSGTYRALEKDGKCPMTMFGFYPDFPDPENDIEIITTNGCLFNFQQSMEANKTLAQIYDYDEFTALDVEGKALWNPQISPEENTARKDNYIKQQEMIAEYVYCIPYYFGSGFLIYHPYVKNLNPHWFTNNWATPGVLACYKEPPE